MNAPITGITGNGHARCGVRRLVGLEREYRCSSGHEHRSWDRIRTCPNCGESLSVAIIRRAALV